MGNNNVLRTVNSFIIAIIISSGFIARMIAALGGLEEGIVPALFIFALLVSFITIILTKDRIKIEKNSMIFLYFIILIFLLSFLFRGFDSYASIYFIEFVFYGIITFLLSLLKFSPSQVIYFTMLIGNIILINPIAFLDYVSRGYTYDYVSMDAVYAILPCIAATIIYFIFLKKKGNILVNILSLLSNSYLLYLVMFEGSRGAVFAVGFLFVMIFYILISNKIKINFGIGSVYSFLIAILFMVLTIVITNIQNALLWIDKLLLSLDIEIAAITKTINMIERGGVLGILNARDMLYERGYELFKESPVFGHGIGAYADLYYGTYPHNLFLHLLIEGGIIFTIPFILLLTIILWFLIKPWAKADILYEKRLFILFLFIISIPRLTFSSYLWREQAFWLLLFFLFSFLSKQKEKPNIINFTKEKNRAITTNS